MWGEVTGNVTVQGILKSFGATFDKNVTVDGGAFKALNYGTTIKGNLTISNSAGDPNPNDTNANGFFAPIRRATSSATSPIPAIPRRSMSGRARPSTATSRSTPIRAGWTSHSSTSTARRTSHKRHQTN
jgi:hypothetical protein